MAWIIALLVLAGIALLIIEVVFIPGTTVVGLLGLLFLAAGVSFSYSHYGGETGFYVLLLSGMALAAALYVSFRKNAWKKFSLNKSIDSRVNQGITGGLTLGMEGVAVSALRPAGSAEFNGKILEVTTQGTYLAAGSRIKIVQIDGSTIVVAAADN
jgi:membrane-bound ClpP family serine protease